MYCLLLFFICPSSAASYTLSLHDALPISCGDGGPRELTTTVPRQVGPAHFPGVRENPAAASGVAAMWQSASEDRKSTRLNSSHVASSYAVFRLKKKINQI